MKSRKAWEAATIASTVPPHFVDAKPSFILKLNRADALVEGGADLEIGWLTATVSSIADLYTSFRFDLPTGAAIVCALGAALLLTAVGAGFFRKTVLASRLHKRP